MLASSGRLLAGSSVFFFARRQPDRPFLPTQRPVYVFPAANLRSLIGVAHIRESEKKMKNDGAFTLIQEAVHDPSFFQRLVTDSDEIFKERGIVDPALREDVKLVIAGLASRAENATAASYQAQHDTTLQTADSFKSALRDTVQQIEGGFRATMVMYSVAFYLGVALIVSATVMAFLKEKSLLPIVFGTLGMADMIAYFITKPPQDLQFSRARLAQLQAAFFNWFIDYTNWNGVLMTWTQDGKAELQTIKTVSEILMQHTEKTMALIDTYCGSPRAIQKAKGEL